MKHTHDNLRRRADHELDAALDEARSGTLAGAQEALRVALQTLALLEFRYGRDSTDTAKAKVDAIAVALETRLAA